MAVFEPKDFGRSLMQGLVLEVDLTHALREAFGWGHWRLRLATALFALGARILRCHVETKGPPE